MYFCTFMYVCKSLNVNIGLHLIHSFLSDDDDVIYKYVCGVLLNIHT